MSWSLRASMGCPFRKFDPSDSQCEAESSHHQVRCLPWGALAIFGHLTRARGGGRGFPFLFFAGCRPLVPPGKRDADRAAELRRRSRWPPAPPICRYGAKSGARFVWRRRLLFLWIAGGAGRARGSASARPACIGVVMGIRFDFFRHTNQHGRPLAPVSLEVDEWLETRHP